MIWATESITGIHQIPFVMKTLPAELLSIRVLLYRQVIEVSARSSVAWSGNTFVPLRLPNWSVGFPQSDAHYGGRMVVSAPLISSFDPSESIMGLC